MNDVHYPTLLAYIGGALTLFLEWVQAQAWITNTVGLVTIIWTSILILTWLFKMIRLIAARLKAK